MKRWRVDVDRPPDFRPRVLGHYRWCWLAYLAAWWYVRFCNTYGRAVIKELLDLPLPLPRARLLK